MKKKIKNVIYLSIFLIVVILLNFYLLNKDKDKNVNENNSDLIKFNKHDTFLFNKIVNKYKFKDKIIYYNSFDQYPNNLPEIIDLRSKCPEIYEQGKLGTCHVQGICFLYHYITKQLNIDFIPSRMFLEYTSHQFFHPSRNFLNYNEEIKNFIFTNAGGFETNDLFSIFIDGVCDEKMYPYPDDELLVKYDKNINLINNIRKNINHGNKIDNMIKINKLYDDIKLIIPSKNNFKNAKKHRILDCIQINYNIDEMKKCLNYVGPIAFSLIHAKFFLNDINIYIYNPAIKIKLVAHKILLNNYSKDKNLNILLEKFIKSIEDLLNNLNSKNYKLLNNIQDNIKNSLNNLEKNEIYKTELSDLPFTDKKFINEIYKNLEYKESELLIKFPTDLINDCFNILKKYNIDLNKIIKYIEYEKIHNFHLGIDDLLNLNEEKRKSLIKNDDFKYVTNFLEYFSKDNSGHVMSVVGYNDNKKYFIIRNSWGKNYGKDGYFYLDYEYFTNRKYLYGCNIYDLFLITKTTDGSISFINN